MDLSLKDPICRRNSKEITPLSLNEPCRLLIAWKMLYPVTYTIRGCQILDDRARTYYPARATDYCRGIARLHPLNQAPSGMEFDSVLKRHHPLTLYGRYSCRIKLHLSHRTPYGEEYRGTSGNLLEVKPVIFRRSAASVAISGPAKQRCRKPTSDDENVMFRCFCRPREMVLRKSSGEVAILQIQT